MDTMVEVGINSDNTLGLVTPTELNRYWPAIQDIMIANPRGLLDGWWNLQQVYAMLANNVLDLWLGVQDEQDIQLVVLCRKESYYGFTLYRIVWIGGKLKPFTKVGYETILAYCKYLKIDKLAFDGRKGFVPIAKKLGFSPLRIEMWKSVSEVN